MRRLPGLIAGALLAAIWAHALTGFGGAGTADFFGRWMHDGVILAAAVGCLVSAIPRSSDRLAWGALSAGLFASLTGDIIYSLAPDLDAVPVPSASEPFWLAIYPCLYVAMIALIRSRIGRTLWATRLDGLAGGLAIASVLACVTVSEAVEGSAGAPFWEAATNLAYPVCDLMLLGSIVSAVGLAGWRIDRLWGTLGAAIVALETADLIYMTGFGGVPGGVVADAFVATGIVGLAWATSLAPAARATRPVTTDRGLFVPVGFGALALGVLALGVPLHVNAVALGLAVAALGLVLARTALALGENHALLRASRVEAATDPLTGLSNRRRLEIDLAGVLQADTPHALLLLDLTASRPTTTATATARGTSSSTNSAQRSRRPSTGTAPPTASAATSSACSRRSSRTSRSSPRTAPPRSPRAGTASRSRLPTAPSCCPPKAGTHRPCSRSPTRGCTARRTPAGRRPHSSRLMS
jgi:hypothetical protein